MTYRDILTALDAVKPHADSYQKKCISKAKRIIEQQVPLEPICEGLDWDGIAYRCPDCGMPLDENSKHDYCPGCGRAVMWE